MRFGKVLIFLIAAGVLAGCPVTQRQDTPVAARNLTEPVLGSKYWLYVPSYYSEDRSWPLVVTLHGSKIWDGSHRQMMEWKYLAEQEGFLVAAPKVKSAEGILPVFRWFRQLADDEQAVLAVIDHVLQNYPAVDRKAVMLTGFSAGGYPLYYIGLRNPGRFDMLVARACNSSVEILEQIKLTDEVRDLPIAIFWGKDDLKPIQDQSWRAFRWLREHRCFATRMKQLRGGHLRRPATAYQFWMESRQQRHQQARQR